MINIILFGKPGAGKGTQADVIKEKYGLVHISTGSVFRYNISENTTLGQQAKTYINKGELVPDTLTIDMLHQEIEKTPNAKGFLFDGFPRTTDQAKSLDTFLKSKQMNITATITLEADDDELIKRLLERGKITGRTDDQSEEKIRNRFEEYNNKTRPLIAFYTQQNKFYTINGIGNIDEITQRICGVIDQFV